MRHTFIGSIVDDAAEFELGRRVRCAILNDNEFGVALQFTSGMPVNLRSNLELNNDGIASDRPLGVARNSLYLPARKNVDLRYSRWIPHPAAAMARRSDRGDEERVQHRAAVGRERHGRRPTRRAYPVAPISYDAYQLRRPAGYEQRQFQLGFKLRF